jgi:leukotriene-A4 hydrolase
MIPRGGAVLMKCYLGWLVFACLFVMSCQNQANRLNQTPPNTQAAAEAARDVHSYANPEQVRVRHVDLDLAVLFDRKVLQGAATLTLERAASSDTLKLDTRDLKISKAEASTAGASFAPAQFTLGAADKILGTPLTITLPPNATKVRIEYESSPNASGVQWLEPTQTAGKKQPYMFTQSQAIHARSWIPLQDSPGVRVTYRAPGPFHLMGRSNQARADTLSTCLKPFPPT